MALINNIYILVEKEDLDNEIETVTHPTESGFPIADSIRKNPRSLSISGKIADTANLNAVRTIAKIKNLQKSGSLITYVGQCGRLTNLQIQSFNDSYSNKNYGGADFSMTLKEIKTAKSAYVAPKNTIAETTILGKVAVGNNVRFAGGYVYVSSDATKASAKRGASTCRLTKISSLSNAKHKYHLISQDCKYGSPNYVYGWVDADRVSGVPIKQKSSTNGGTQQVQGNDPNPIVHTVKKGDTLYHLATVTYKNKNLTVAKIMNDNPDAFSKKGDVTTLKIGAKLKLYWISTL